MKEQPTPPNDGKTPHERFVALGKKVLAVPKSEVDTRDEAWREQRKKRPKQ